VTPLTAPSRTPKTYSIFELVFGNMAIILWITLGSAAVGLFNLLASLGYFSLLAFLVFFELGKHGCVTCYYCKTCTIGMGKLPEFFFKKNGTANVNARALRMFPFVFTLLSVIPSFLVVFSAIQELVASKIVLVVAILCFSLYTGTIRRKPLIT
jgi:hypothetical protein